MTSNLSKNYSLHGYAVNGLRFVDKIGAGTYGLIYTVEDASGARYAAKMVLKYNLGSNVAENKKYIERSLHHYFSERPAGTVDELDLSMVARDGAHCPFLKEIALQLRVHQHPSVATIHSVLNLGDVAVMTVMDWYEQGDLFGNIIDRQIFSQCPAPRRQLLMKNAMLQLVEALQYLHDNNIYHCDLKPENIMVRYDPAYVREPDTTAVVDRAEIHLVLIDFGLAVEDDLICCNACRGSSFYMAPERVVNFNTNHRIQNVINLHQYVELPATAKACSLYFPTLAGDVWSLGVLFINIACSRNPWPIASIADRPGDGANEVFKNYIFNNRDVLRTILPISSEFNRVLDRIFQLSPNDRIPLRVLGDAITACDFFHDKPLALKHHFNYKTTDAAATVSVHHDSVPRTLPAVAKGAAAAPASPHHLTHHRAAESRPRYPYQLFTPPETEEHLAGEPPHDSTIFHKKCHIYNYTLQTPCNSEASERT